MSNIETPPPAGDVAGAINVGASPAVTAPPTDGGQDFRSLWEQEKAERIRERNLYKPVQNMLRDLDDDAVAAITSLTELARRGDTQGITDWALATAQNVSGSDLASLIAARQNSGQQPFQPQQQAPVQQQGGIQSPETQRALDIDTARQIAREEAAAYNQVQSVINQVTSVLTSAGYPPDSPAGQTIIRYASATGVAPEEAIAWYTADLDARAAQRVAALSAAANGTPATAPNGTPVGASPAVDMTPQQKARERLLGGRSA